MDATPVTLRSAVSSSISRLERPAIVVSSTLGFLASALNVLPDWGRDKRTGVDKSVTPIWADAHTSRGFDFLRMNQRKG